jgi:hypothetical protein
MTVLGPGVQANTHTRTGQPPAPTPVANYLNTARPGLSVDGLLSATQIEVVARPG